MGSAFQYKSEGKAGPQNSSASVMALARALYIVVAGPLVLVFDEFKIETDYQVAIYLLNPLNTNSHTRKSKSDCKRGHRFSVNLAQSWVLQ
jgi:hypothetical protein